jgi:hypothetical protein
MFAPLLLLLLLLLLQVHALIDRYKAGQYVSEDDLDWAFRQLEQRAWRS